ncbi:MAG: CCA tRNA nucleotidyltransferase, partial [Actinomycetota bacterium]
MRDLSADAVPSPALELAGLFRDAGFGLWLVGGWVRDRLLDRPDEGDLDFATDARPEDTLRLLKRWGTSAPWTSGMEFGTIGVEKAGTRVEVTTFRSEVYEAGSRNPRVEFGDSL